jgi:hypothetical protein
MFGNYNYRKQIGYYINESIPDKYTQNDLNQIISKSKSIFEEKDTDLKINIKYKESCENFILFYLITKSNTFYLSAVTNNYEYEFKEDEIYELFNDLENQGIRKLTDKNGELSKIGRQNLKFCLEQNYQKINKETSSILNYFKSQNDSVENLSKISLLSTQINETSNDGKEERKKFLENDGENNGDKNNGKNDEVKINDFKDDEMILQKRRKCRKVTALMCLVLMIIAIITMIYIFFYNKND